MFTAEDEYAETSPELDDYIDPFGPNSEPCADCCAEAGEACDNRCPNRTQPA